MSDLISRQAAIKAIEDLQDCYNGFSDTYDKACIIGVIEEVPPIELNGCEYWDSESRFCALRRPQAEPIKRGQWIKNEGRSGWHCSYCGKDDLYAYPYTENNERELQDFYCPNCGAQMIDEGKNDRT